MQTYEVTIELDKDGNVDTAYYIQQAHTLRAQAMAEGVQALKQWFKGLKISFNSTRLFGTVAGH